MNEFEKQVIIMLGKILEKQSEHDSKFNTIDTKINNLDSKINNLDTKINAVMDQTAKNTEHNTITTIKYEQLENEVKQIKEHLKI